MSLCDIVCNDQIIVCFIDVHYSIQYHILQYSRLYHKVIEYDCCKVAYDIAV